MIGIWLAGLSWLAFAVTILTVGGSIRLPFHSDFICAILLTFVCGVFYRSLHRDLIVARDPRAQFLPRIQPRRVNRLALGVTANLIGVTVGLVIVFQHSCSLGLYGKLG